MELQIGLIKSSRIHDIERLVGRWYPAATLIPVTSVSTLQQVDVLLAGGGVDFDPTLYGEPDRHCKGTDPQRDANEFELVRQALAGGLPFLGLCRGAQLLNVVLGGTLYQDLLLERGAGHPKVHPVQFSGVGQQHLGELVQVNSTHHQGVHQLGRGLTVIGTAPDGLPEAWHQPGAIGVQFHPETLIHEDDRWLRLFQWWLDGAA